MAKPPSGYEDLLADARSAPELGDPEPLDVPDVGVLSARRPAPRSTAMLALCAQPSIGGSAALGHLHTFVCDHIGEEQVDELLDRMMIEDMPEDTLGRVARALATWGTSRPWRAVITLASLTGRDWRTVRTHLLNHGVSDPMSLSSMHRLLDVAEAMVLESMSGKTQGETERKREQFLSSLYAPEIRTVPSGEAATPPEGFSDAETENAFESFSKAIP